MKLPYEAVLFDFDGVIIDSMGIKTEAFRQMFAPYGNKIVNKVIEYHLKNGGISRQKKFKHFYKNYISEDLSNDDLNELCNIFSTLVLDKVLEAPWIPGAKEFLDAHYNENTFYLISGIPQEELDFIVDKRDLRKYFKLVLGSPKSKVENIKDVIGRNYYNHTKLLYIGDSISDWSESQDVGINFLGLTTTPKFPAGIKTINDFKRGLDAIQD